MAQLTVENGPESGQTMKFSEGDHILVGSGADCSMQLSSPGIAAEHFVIKALKNGGFGIKGLDGPMSVNGKTAEAARLSEGDVIEIANVRLRFGKPKATDTGKLGRLGGYELLEVLGKGGHGTVYRAEQLSLRRHVALKVLPEKTTKNPEFVGRFVAEARAAARLSHPNVVQVFDVGHDGDTYFLSMEIMAKGSLEDRLRDEGHLSVEETLPLIIDAAKGLVYAESMRIVHRDIKPDNLMVDEHDTAKIADLGLAMSDDEEQGKIVGTPHFMSPEQATGRPLDHRSDLYSLGCTFFRLVTGRTVFPRSRTKEILRAHVKDAPDSADEVNEAVPANVAAVIDQLIEKDPDERYQSAADLIEDLKAILNPPAKRGMTFAIIGVILVIVGGAAIYFGTRDNTVIIKQTDAEKQAQLQKQLREQKAETERLSLMQQNSGTADLELAEKLEKFAAAETFQNTPAAATATAKAKELRAAAAARAAATKAHDAAVKTAEQQLTTRIQKLIQAADIRGAWTALAATDVAEPVRADQRIQDVLAGLKGQLTAKAATVLEELQKAATEAASRKDLAAAEGKLAAIRTAIGAGGWPQELIADRTAVAAFLQSTQAELKTLRTELASSAETKATAAYRNALTGESGILSALLAFDIATAQQRAEAAAAAAAGFKAERAAQEMQTMVAAAANYWQAFQAEVQKGALTLDIKVDGAMTTGKLVAFDPQAGVEVQLGEKAVTQPIATVAAGRTHKVFPSIAKHEADRTAFLALYAVGDHLTAARTFMAGIDYAAVEKGGTTSRFGRSLDELNATAKLLRELDAPWRNTLRREVRGCQSLSQGLLAFSQQHFSRAATHLSKVRKEHTKTLAWQVATAAKH